MIENEMFIQMFVGIILEKPLRDFTRPLGNSQRFKRLVAYAQCNRFPTKVDLCLYCVFHFFFAKGLAKCKFGGI
jgi:hypothetical protein